MRFVKKIYNYYFSPERELAKKLTSILGFIPLRLSVFKLAFYHRSMNNQDNNTEIHNNERLEYLGDAILSTIVAEYLFRKYPNKNEGFLTQMRSKIVKRKTLNDIAEKMGLDIILKNYSNSKLSSAMMGNALEALVGALYLELGYRKTCNYVINKILRKYLDIHELEEIDDNHKSQLLEWCQKYNKDVEFRLLQKSKKDKRDYFTVGVFVNNIEYARADDFNKKSAEQTASMIALEKLTAEQE